jgi:hypothetical protein
VFVIVVFCARSILGEPLPFLVPKKRSFYLIGAMSSNYVLESIRSPLRSIRQKSELLPIVFPPKLHLNMGT